MNDVDEVGEDEEETPSAKMRNGKPETKQLGKTTKDTIMADLTRQTIRSGKGEALIAGKNISPCTAELTLDLNTEAGL